jgi:hypothetical protein
VLPALAAGRLLRLDGGLYALKVGALADAPVSSYPLGPMIQVSAPPSDEFDPVEIVGAGEGQIRWIGQEGGTVVVQSPPGGGTVLIAVFGAEERQVPNLSIYRLGGAGPGGREASSPRPRQESAHPPIPVAVGLHIERVGDRRFAGDGWAGIMEQQLRIEAFSIHPLAILAPTDIEYMGFGPGGRETAWVSEGRWCGTRGQATPLTGFAVRVAQRLRDRFAVRYEGRFAAGGTGTAAQDGEQCASPLTDDPLTAMRLRLVERAGDER